MEIEHVLIVAKGDNISDIVDDLLHIVPQGLVVSKMDITRYPNTNSYRVSATCVEGG